MLDDSDKTDHGKHILNSLEHLTFAFLCSKCMIIDIKRSLISKYIMCLLKPNRTYHYISTHSRMGTLQGGTWLHVPIARLSGSGRDKEMSGDRHYRKFSKIKTLQ